MHFKTSRRYQCALHQNISFWRCQYGRDAAHLPFCLVRVTSISQIKHSFNWVFLDLMTISSSLLMFLKIFIGLMTISSSLLMFLVYGLVYGSLTLLFAKESGGEISLRDYLVISVLNVSLQDCLPLDGKSYITVTHMYSSPGLTFEFRVKLQEHCN